MNTYPDAARALAELQPRHGFLVGIDSDGCAIDTMEVKHKECFIPNIIKHWGLQAVSKYAREAAEFVNLYSKWRGGNRWPALVMVFDLLRERQEVRARHFEPPTVPRLREFIVDENFPRSNDGLRAFTENRLDPELETAMAWTTGAESPGKGADLMKATTPSRKAATLLVTCVVTLLGAVDAPGQTALGYPRVMQGPMVGAVTETEARIWLRLSGEYPVVIDYGTSPAPISFASTQPIVAKPADDYTAVVRLQGLEPDTQYFYRVKVNGVDDRYLRDFPPFRFKTAPLRGTATSLRVAFGSCPRFQDDRVQPIWEQVSNLEPDLFLWIGDNIYGDSVYPHVLQEEYRRQRDVAGLQPVLHNVSHLAVWDDHDFALNNSDRTNPLKAEALQVFKQYWANPSYGLPDTPGVFFTYSFGAVDFFFLDDRTYRDPDEAPDTPEKTFLGDKQFSWLQHRLVESKAVFKVLVSGSGFSVEKGSGGDSWASFIHARNRLFDFIRDKEISGVVLVSGDTHIGELNVIAWSEHGGYDLYDLVSSPLAQKPPDSWLEHRPERRIRPVYFQGSNVGVIDFIFDGSPRLTYRVIDTQGRNVWAPFLLHASELVNGTTSWPDKVDDGERQRQESYEAGKGYYEIEP